MEVDFPKKMFRSVKLQKATKKKTVLIFYFICQKLLISNYILTLFHQDFLQHHGPPIKNVVKNIKGPLSLDFKPMHTKGLEASK